MDVDHAEVVGMAPGGAGVVLASSEISVLFGVELYLAGLFPEDGEGLLVGDLQERGRRAGSRRLGLGDLARLLQRHSPVP
jgi:hypothetical protein